MTRAAITALLACFPIWMRPFVWVQLMLIKRWQGRCGRPALIEVCYATGRLRLVHIGDAPRDATLYHYKAPRHTAWARLALARPARMPVFIRASSVLSPCMSSGMCMARPRHVLTSLKRSS